MRLVLLLVILSSAQIGYSQALPLYYGSDFLNSYRDNTLQNDDLKNALFTLLTSGHVKIENSPDRIVSNCASAGTEISDVEKSKCVEHRVLGYDGARRKLFGQLYLQKLTSGYAVTDVYCERTFTDADFGGSPTFGPDMVPSSGNVINTEHTWPQSRFTGRFPREMQKSDINHLFPTDSEMNSRRGSLRFGNVVETVEALKCPQNKLGHQAEGGIIFEVPDAQKGNTARAIFYFATRYQMKISPPEEAALRGWHKRDPVDAAEYEKNNLIEMLQGNRNPFVDFSDLIDRIESFN